MIMTTGMMMVVIRMKMIMMIVPLPPRPCNPLPRSLPSSSTSSHSPPHTFNTLSLSLPHPFDPLPLSPAFLQHPPTLPSPFLKTLPLSPLKILPHPLKPS